MPLNETEQAKFNRILTYVKKGPELYHDTIDLDKTPVDLEEATALESNAQIEQLVRELRHNLEGLQEAVSAVPDAVVQKKLRSVFFLRKPKEE